MKILDGRLVANKLLSELAVEVNSLKLRHHVHPKLAVILVGQNPASLSYIRQKQKACDKVGIEWVQFDYSEEVSQKELLEKIEELNEDEKIHGVLVQLPLPGHLVVPELLKAIDPKKDVDGFTAYNLGKMFLAPEFEHLAPCTPRGVIKILEHYEISVKGKEVVVVGHSNIVGKPLSTMLLNRNATVTTCHIDTQDLAFHTKRADILCVAVGKVNLITADMVKDGVVVVDIGINRIDNPKFDPEKDEGKGNKKYKLVGDTDFEGLGEKASYITPVPGGAGPMTVACLMENTVTAAKRLNGMDS